MTTQETSSVNLLSYLRIFFRRKWFFIIPLLVGLGVGFFMANTLPKVYESYTVILIEEEKLDNPIISGLAVSRSAAQRLRNLRDQILGWNRLVKLAERLGLTKNIKNQAQLEGLILNDLRSNILVNMRGPSLVRIAFRGESPEKTQVVVKTISDIFIEENISAQNQESDIAISFLEEQLKIYHKKIKESEIAGMEDQLDKLLIDSTEAHPMVKDLRAKINKAKEDALKNQDNIIENPEFIKDPVYDTLKTNLENEIATIKASQIIAATSPGQTTEATSEDLYKVALMSNISNVLARDISVNQQIYNMLLQRLETARISKRLEATKEGTRYTVLDPPRIPLSPVSPNKPLVTLIGALIGAALGFGLIVLLEVLDTSFLGVDEAKAVLDLPILGAISRITTAEDIAKEKAQKTMRLGISLTASVAFIFVVIIYSIITKP